MNRLGIVFLRSTSILRTITAAGGSGPLHCIYAVRRQGQAAVDIEERERYRRELLLHYALVEAALLAQPQTLVIVEMLADLKRSRERVLALSS